MARGVAEAAGEAGTWVLGGDTNEGPALSIGCSAAGLVPEASVLTRMGARPGEGVFVTGPLGLGAARAAAAFLGEPSLLSEEEFRPPCRIPHGRALRDVASAAMDTSDGLIATLDQLARLNGIAIRLTRPAAELLHPRAAAAGLRAGLSPLALLGVLHGEFELVFTVPESRRAALAAAAARLDWVPLEIGITEPGRGIFAGDRPIDGARVRNLLSECRGNPDAYAAALAELAT